MNENDLVKLLSQRETEHLELKPSLSDSDRIVEIVASLANSGGGIVVIGISTHSKILGVTIGKQTIERLTNTITDNIDPVIYPNISAHNLEGKKIIVVEVTEGLNKPYLAFGRPFKRVGNVTKHMKRDEYEKLLLEKSVHKPPFDSEICHEALLENINWDKVDWLRTTYKAISGKEILTENVKLLENLGCVKKNKITNGGILLFGKTPERFFPQNQVTIVRYPSKSVSDRYLDLRDINGNLFNLIDQTDEYIREHIQIASRLIPGQINREEIPQYPLFAIRELAINAVAHRDYSVQGSRIIIKMFKDRIEFSSPGGFPAGITPENIVDRQYSKNPIIVKALNMVRYIEAIGDGIDRVLEAVRTHPLKPQMVLFRDVGSNVIVTLYSADMSKLDFMGQEKLALTDKEKNIVDMLRDKARITGGDVQKKFDVSRDTANRYLLKLIKLGLVRREGTGKATYYTLK